MSPLYALLTAAVVALVILALVRDGRRQRARRVAWEKEVTVLSVASRARTMDELPAAFLVELRRAMRVDDHEEILD